MVRVKHLLLVLKYMVSGFLKGALADLQGKSEN